MTLRGDGEVIETRTVDLDVGENPVEFTVTLGGSGIRTYTATVDHDGDQVARNNTAQTAVEVMGESVGGPGGGGSGR